MCIFHIINIFKNTRIRDFSYHRWCAPNSLEPFLRQDRTRGTRRGTTTSFAADAFPVTFFSLGTRGARTSEKAQKNYAKNAQQMEDNPSKKERPEVIEASIKLSRHATGKTNVIAFQGSFHGRTIGTMSLTHSKTIYKERYGTPRPSIYSSCHSSALIAHNR